MPARGQLTSPGGCTQTYVTNLNAVLEKYAEAEGKGDVATMVALQGAIKFNGGGHVNHSIFWVRNISSVVFSVSGVGAGVEGVRSAW